MVLLLPIFQVINVYIIYMYMLETDNISDRRGDQVTPKLYINDLVGPVSHNIWSAQFKGPVGPNII